MDNQSLLTTRRSSWVGKQPIVALLVQRSILTLRQGGSAHATSFAFSGFLQSQLGEAEPSDHLKW
jgi:hypothetical protein